MKDKRQELLSFLDERVFTPVLQADSTKYKDQGETKLLARVQARVRATQIRYHSEYGTAAEIGDRFFEDLHSQFGKDLAADMWLLGFTPFEDCIQEFLALCNQLGV